MVRKVELRRGEIIPVVNEVLGQYTFPLTVRQIYYRLVSDPYLLFTNTKQHYNSFDNILTRARERGEVDPKGDRIVDDTRHTWGGDTGWDSPEKFLIAYLDHFRNSWKDYDKEMWVNQEHKLEVWVEKAALARVLDQVTSPVKVLLFPHRGNPSYIKVKEAVKRLQEFGAEVSGKPLGKKVCILHLTDHDPTGLKMTQELKSRLGRYGGSFIEVRRIGLTIEQVRQFNLSPNFAKSADRNYPEYVEKYGEECWELDALPPEELQAIVKQEIESYIDDEAWEQKEQEIEEEKEIAREKVEDPEVQKCLKIVEKLILGEED